MPYTLDRIPLNHWRLLVLDCSWTLCFRWHFFHYFFTWLSRVTTMAENRQHMASSPFVSMSSILNFIQKFTLFLLRRRKNSGSIHIGRENTTNQLLIAQQFHFRPTYFSMSLWQQIMLIVGYCLYPIIGLICYLNIFFTHFQLSTSVENIHSSGVSCLLIDADFQQLSSWNCYWEFHHLISR